MKVFAAAVVILCLCSTVWAIPKLDSLKVENVSPIPCQGGHKGFDDACSKLCIRQGYESGACTNDNGMCKCVGGKGQGQDIKFNVHKKTVGKPIESNKLEPFHAYGDYCDPDECEYHCAYEHDDCYESFCHEYDGCVCGGGPYC